MTQMQLFIFGAGASLGSQKDENDESRKAPLVNDLFDPKYARQALEVGLTTTRMQEYQEEANRVGSLEVWLTEWWDKTTTFDEQYLHAAKADFGRISFYLWRLLQTVSDTYSSANLYRTMMMKVRNANAGDFGLISFNYDTLLDRAYQEVFGLPVECTLDSYLAANLVKPHGSVNWFLLKRDSDPSVTGSEQNLNVAVRFSMASKKMYNGAPLPVDQIHVVDPTHSDLRQLEFVANGRFAREYFYPLILMPLSTKLYRFVADFHDKMVAAAIKLAERATDIYLIGYRASDEIAATILSKAPPYVKLHVVGRADAETIMDDVLARHPQLIKGDVHKDGFQDFVEKY